MEDSVAQGRMLKLKKKQEETLRSKAVVLAELEKLKQPLAAAVAEEQAVAVKKYLESEKEKKARVLAEEDYVFVEDVKDGKEERDDESVIGVASAGNYGSRDVTGYGEGNFAQYEQQDVLGHYDGREIGDNDYSHMEDVSFSYLYDGCPSWLVRIEVSLRSWNCSYSEEFIRTKELVVVEAEGDNPKGVGSEAEVGGEVALTKMTAT
ncbi:hypothetical protein QQ045_031412 [Rhodiola kirilowii]